MATVERGVPLVERIIRQVKPHVQTSGAKRAQLDALESRLMVELPLTLRRYLEFDFTFGSFGPQWRGRGRFGSDAAAPNPRLQDNLRLFGSHLLQERPLRSADPFPGS